MTVRPSIDRSNSKAKSRAVPDRTSVRSPITTAAAARLLGVTAPTIIKYLERGKLDGITLPSGHRRVTAESVDRYLGVRP